MKHLKSFFILMKKKKSSELASVWWEMLQKH